MNGIINIKKSLEDSVLLINGVTETVKHEIKQHEGNFFGILSTPVDASLVQPLISSVVKGISRRGEKQEEDIRTQIFISTPSFK